MNDQRGSRNYSKIFSWMLVPLILVAVAGIGLAAERRVLHQPKAANTVADMPQDEFERRVRTYLLEHPEVITEAISRLEARQAELDAAQVKTLLKEHTDEIFRDPDSPVGGNPAGDVTLVEFFDYNCPYCRQMAPLMTQAEAEDPQLRIVYKEFPILGPNSVVAAKAALAAKNLGQKHTTRAGAADHWHAGFRRRRSDSCGRHRFEDASGRVANHKGQASCKVGACDHGRHGGLLDECQISESRLENASAQNRRNALCEL